MSDINSKAYYSIEPTAEEEGVMKKLNLDDKQLVWTEALIQSMTVQERCQPKIINGSRRKRIAEGSGRSVQDVNQLIKEFFQIKKMMKQMR